MNIHADNAGGGRIKVGIKFCGGCNPLYNRHSLFTEIIERYPEMDIGYLSNKPDNPVEDLVIILCGCHSQCVNYTDLQGAYGQLALLGPEDFYKV